MADGMMKIDDEESQTSRSLILVQHKLTVYDLYYLKQRPAYPVVIIHNNTHAVQQTLHVKQSIDECL